MYKPTNATFTVKHLMETSGIATEELQRFTGWMLDNSISLRERIIVNQPFLNYAKKHDCFIIWLDAEGLIYWEEPEVQYKHGNRFYINNMVHILVRSPSVKGHYKFFNLNRCTDTDWNQLETKTLKELNAVWGFLGEIKLIPDFEGVDGYGEPQRKSMEKLFDFCWDVGSWMSKAELASWLMKQYAKKGGTYDPD